jgi:Ca2+-binding EF-hand superfamily protein
VKHFLSLLAFLFVLPSLEAATPAKKAPPREYLPPTLSWLRQVEAMQMLGAILSGTPPASGDMGWFHPGQSQYGWKWLVERMDKNRDGKITKQEFTGSTEQFDRLDRDHNGRLTPADFDWSDDAPINRQMRMIHPLFRRADADHDEKITRAEWQALFEQMAKGKEALRREDLHALLFPPPPPPTNKPPAGMPSPWTLLKGLLEGEIGSFHEGPNLGQRAPDFTLPRYDNEKSITLSQFRGKKPVVLVFGSFT